METSVYSEQKKDNSNFYVYTNKTVLRDLANFYVEYPYGFITWNKYLHFPNTNS